MIFDRELTTENEVANEAVYELLATEHKIDKESLKGLSKYSRIPLITFENPGDPSTRYAQ